MNYKHLNSLVEQNNLVVNLVIENVFNLKKNIILKILEKKF